jgi:hypothetical protein
MTDPELKPLPESVLEKLRQVSTSTIATQLYKRGFRQSQLLGVKPLSEVADGFVGEAFTMRFIPMREDVDGLDPYRSGNTLQWEAFEALPSCAAAVLHPRKRTRADLLVQLLSRTKQRDAAWDALSEIHAEHMARSHIEPAEGPSLCKPCEIHARGLEDMP